MTSHDVVDAVRDALGGAKAGHAGTLDPQATGVLVICLGSATKISSFLIEGVKEYEGRALLGVSTDTQDGAGQVVATRPVECDEAAIREGSRRFVGAIEQVPPMFSAVKIGGQKLYRLARRGMVVDRPSRSVTVHSFAIERVELPSFDFRVVCSRGTYVRSLVHDLGEVLGCGAHLQSLRRTKQGPFALERALDWAALTGPGGADAIRERTISIEEALAFLPEVRVEIPRTGLRAGALRPSGDTLLDGSIARFAGPQGRGLGVARAESGGVRVLFLAPASGRSAKRAFR